MRVPAEPRRGLRSGMVGVRKSGRWWAGGLWELQSAARVVCHTRSLSLSLQSVSHTHTQTCSTQREGGDPAFRPRVASRFWGRKEARSHVLLGRPFLHTA